MRLAQRTVLAKCDTNMAVCIVIWIQNGTIIQKLQNLVVGYCWWYTRVPLVSVGWCMSWCSGEQMLDKNLTSAVDDITKSLPPQHQSQTRSELLQKLTEHSLAGSSCAASTSFTCVFTHTHTFNSLFSRTTWISRYQKGKPFWILLKQEMMGWQWHQLDHMQIICTTLQTDNHDVLDITVSLSTLYLEFCLVVSRHTSI